MDHRCTSTSQDLSVGCLGGVTLPADVPEGHHVAAEWAIRRTTNPSASAALKRVMMRPFEIRHQGRFGEASVLAVAGELDVATGLQVKRSVAELLGTGARAVVIDLRETEFVDSTGMGALLWAARRLRAAGGELRIVNVEPVVARTFELAHLDELIAIEH